MAIRTIIINSDPSWRFRALIWSQALDLFPVRSGVEFRDCVADTQMHADHRMLLGNFPDDLSADPFALNDEMREDVRRLVREPTEHLNIAVVLGHADFECLAAAKPGVMRDSLSKPAVAATDALRTVMDAVKRQTENEHDRVPAGTRLWLSLIVRDGGQSVDDRRRADDAVRQFHSNHSFINNVFFLSNGRDMDKGMGAAELHFAKLRILIDLMRDDDGIRQLRRKSRDQAGIPLALRVSADPTSLSQPALSAELRKALVRESDLLLGELGHATDADIVEKFRNFERDLTELLPGLKEEDYTRVTAASMLDQDVKAWHLTAQQQAGLADAQQDAQDITGILNDLRPPNRGLLPQWHSDRRRARWTRLAAEYEAAFASSERVYESVISQRISDDRKKGTDRQNALKALLRDVSIPTGVTGDAAVARLLERLRVLEAGTIREIQDAQDSRIAIAANIAAEAPMRARAFDVLDRAEDQLLRPATLRSIFLMALIFLLPILVHFGTRWARGRSAFRSLEAFTEALGPIGVLVLGTFALSILAAFFLGIVLSRQRVRVLADIQSRLNLNYSWLKEQYAARLSVAQNRMRLTGLQQARMTVGAPVPTEVFDAVVELMQRLRQGDDVPRRKAATAPGLTQDAVEAFTSERGWQERFAAFLVWATPSTPTGLTVSLPGWADPKTFRTSASLVPITVDLREPGDVR